MSAQTEKRPWLRKVEVALAIAVLLGWAAIGWRSGLSAWWWAPALVLATVIGGRRVMR